MIFTDGDPGPEIRRKLNEMVSTWEDALISAVGPQGWSPSLAVVADGARSVLQVIDWVGGEGAKPTITGYIGATGIVATAALAVDIRGSIGATGPSNTLAIGTVTSAASPSATITGASPNQTLNLVLPKGDKGDTGNIGPANSLNIGTVVSGASASATISGTAPTQELNLVLPKGDNGLNGLNGLNGWSPVLAVATDGERRVLEVVDWIGGEGTKPAITGYIGATGIVVNIADAINVRGPVGAEGDTGPANSLSIGTVTEGVAAATITGTAPSQTLNLVLPKATDGADGLAATVAVGTVTTGAPGTSATVVNSGTSSAAVFDFTIPRGDTGAAGSGSGDVVGTASATNNGVALFDGTTGKIIKDGGVLGTAAFEAATSFATAAQGTKADTAVQPGSLATVATSGAYADLTGKPTLGTASTLNVPATGNAAAGEVVKGNDTRLSDSRTPTGAAGGVLSGSYPNPGFAVDMATQAELDVVSGVANSKLSDAPIDGKIYGRKDVNWVEVAGGGIYKLPILSAAAVDKSPVSGSELLDFNCFYPTGLPGANSVVSCGGLFVACTATNSSPDFATSPDGKVWTLRTTTDGNAKIIACDGISVVVAKRAVGAEIWVSANKGVTWVKKTNMPGNALSNSVPAIHNGIILIQASAANTLYRSTDYGTTWTTVSVPFATLAFPIVAVADRFVAPAYFGAYYSSSDGITWTEHSGLPVSGATTYSERSFYRFSANAAGNPVVETTDGLNFSVVPSIAVLASNDIPTKINGMNVGVVSGSTWHTSGPITRTFLNRPSNKNIATNGSLTVYGATGGVVVIDSTNLQTGWFGD